MSLGSIQEWSRAGLMIVPCLPPAAVLCVVLPAQCVALVVLPEALGCSSQEAPQAPFLAQLMQRLLLPPPQQEAAGPAAGGGAGMGEEEGRGGHDAAASCCCLEVLGCKLVPEPTPGLVQVMLDNTSSTGQAKGGGGEMEEQRGGDQADLQVRGEVELAS